MLDLIETTFDNLWALVTSGDFVYSPIYLAAAVLIAYAVWRMKGLGVGFLEYILPRQVYTHASTRVDIKIAIFNFIFLSTGALSVLMITPVVTIGLLEVLNDLIGAPVATGGGLVQGVVVVVLLFLTQDFCRFLNHYLHHKNSVLWPFHAVHHSAEVLSPITFMRAHPVYYAFQRILISVLVGVVQALLLFVLVGRIEFWMVYAGTLAFQTYILLGAHLRHSHIPLSYGRVMEHILISPAQHQVHHSSDLKHHDKNFGEIFAIWDWMFGTLYIADGDEKLVFGISNADGERIEQPYPSLRAALVGPFVESWQAMRSAVEAAPSDDAAKPAAATRPSQNG